jgi:hypothetical protein
MNTNTTKKIGKLNSEIFTWLAKKSKKLTPARAAVPKKRNRQNFQKREKSREKKKTVQARVPTKKYGKCFGVHPRIPPKKPGIFFKLHALIPPKKSRKKTPHGTGLLPKTREKNLERSTCAHTTKKNYERITNLVGRLFATKKKFWVSLLPENIFLLGGQILGLGIFPKGALGGQILGLCEPAKLKFQFYFFLV